MAVEGGTTSAYRLKLTDGTLQRTGTTALKTDCAKPLTATAAIMRGESAIVAGSDAVVVARLVELERTVQRMTIRLREIDVEWTE